MFKPTSLFYTDGYKIGHRLMLAPGTTRLYGTWIPRTFKRAPKGIEKVVSFGQQLVVKWLHDEFKENFFSKSESEVEKFGKDMAMYLGLDYDASHFLALHRLGYLPIRVKSLPEGIETPANIPHMTFVNTVDGFAWLTLYLETIISSLAWKPATSASIALMFKRNIVKAVSETDSSNSWLSEYLAHDFSARGLSPWDMISSGLGHATSFRGSDSIIVIPAARYFYNEAEDEVSINSVNASEHSVSTTKIFTVGEQQMIADWLKIFDKGILSIVSDTFDLWKLITEYLPANKEAIMARDGKLVIRPDSGDPVDIICGVSTKYKDLSSHFPEGEVLPEYFEDVLLDEVREDTPHGERGVTEHENIYVIRGKLYKAKIHNISWNRYDKQYYFIDMWEKAKITIEELEWKPSDKGVIELLWDIFGGTVNEQGYKVLDPHIGAIYGDSITLERQLEIYKRLKDKGFAATNIVLGIGSYTYQFNTRDTFGFAAKGSWFEVDEYQDDTHPTQDNGKYDTKSYNIYKDPVTDDGTKKSLKGLVKVNEDFSVDTECSWEEESSGILQTIYEDGSFYNQTSLTEIRKKLNNLINN